MGGFYYEWTLKVVISIVMEVAPSPQTNAVIVVAPSSQTSTVISNKHRHPGEGRDLPTIPLSGKNP